MSEPVDTDKVREWGICDCENLCDEVDDLRARLAEVEAAHSCAANLWAHEVAKVAEQRDRAEAAEARLAEVEALCDDHDQGRMVTAGMVRAAARGEGDRPIRRCPTYDPATDECTCNVPRLTGRAADEFPPIKPMSDPDDDDAWDRLNLPTARGEGDRG